jgi:hypothetical protein
MEELNDYYKKRGGCDLKGILVLAALSIAMSLILYILDLCGTI